MNTSSIAPSAYCLLPSAFRSEATLNNPKIEVDIVDLFNKLDGRFDRLDERFEKIDERFEKIDEKFEKIDEKFEKIDTRLQKIELGQEEIKGEIKALKANQDNLKEQISEIKGSQKAQIWTLIVILATALLGILVAGGRILFFAPKA